MSKQTRVSHPIYRFLLTEVEGFDSLVELDMDMRWSWNLATDEGALLTQAEWDLDAAARAKSANRVAG